MLREKKEIGNPTRFYKLIMYEHCIYLFCYIYLSLCSIYLQSSYAIGVKTYQRYRISLEFQENIVDVFVYERLVEVQQLLY